MLAQRGTMRGQPPRDLPERSEGSADQRLGTGILDTLLWIWSCLHLRCPALTVYGPALATAIRVASTVTGL